MYQIPDQAFEDSLNYALLRDDMKKLEKLTKASENVMGKMDPVLIARDRERHERAQLDSQDGNTAEIHDQFYRDHKLLLALFRVLAVMPVQRTSPGRVTFSWRSPASIYAFFFYCFLTVLVVTIGYERFQLLATIKAFDDYVYGILFVIFLVPHFWIPFVGWGVANHVSVYKTMWGAFQVRYYRVTGRTLEFPHLKMQIILFSSGCLIVAVFFILSLSVLLEGFSLWHTTAYYHVVTMLNMNAALWYINSRALKLASKALSDSFKDDIQIECTATIVSQYRFLWLNLSELLQNLGSAYSRTYALYCLFMLSNITIAVYAAMSQIIDHGFTFSFKEIGLIVDTFYCVFLLFVFCDCSHKATQTIAQGVQDTLLNINLLNVDQPTQKEIDLFIQAIEMNPAVVSLKGYVSVNRGLISSSTRTISIYLIILLQFKLSLISQPIPADLIKKDI